MSDSNSNHPCFCAKIFLLVGLLLTSSCNGGSGQRVPTPCRSAANDDWSDFSGIYRLSSWDTEAYRKYLTAFVDPKAVRPGSDIHIHQVTNQLVLVVFQTRNNEQKTNTIICGTTQSHWTWNNGILLFEKKEQHKGLMLPGLVSRVRRCTVQRDSDGGLKVSSSLLESGRSIAKLPSRNKPVEFDWKDKPIQFQFTLQSISRTNATASHP